MRRHAINARRLHALAEKVSPEYALCVTEDCPDRELTDRVKWVMENRIPREDRDLLVLYADRQSLRDMGRELKCAPETIRTRIIRARARVFEELEKI